MGVKSIQWSVANFSTTFKLTASHDSHTAGRAKGTEIAKPDQEKTRGERSKGGHGRGMWGQDHSGRLGSSQTWI